MKRSTTSIYLEGAGIVAAAAVAGSLAGSVAGSASTGEFLGTSGALLGGLVLGGKVGEATAVIGGGALALGFLLAAVTKTAQVAP